MDIAEARVMAALNTAGALTPDQLLVRSRLTADRLRTVLAALRDRGHIERHTDPLRSSWVLTAQGSAWAKSTPGKAAMAVPKAVDG